MAITALVIALLSLATALVAYWRSGGRQDAHQLHESLHRELEVVRARQKELLDNAAHALAAARERNRQRLVRARERLHRQSEDAVEGVEKQIKFAQDQLEMLTKRVEEAADATKEATISAARSTQEAIAQRVRRIEARVTLIRAKARIARSRSAAGQKEFDRADQLLVEAAELLRDAREILRDDHAYEAQLSAIRGSLLEATAAVRSQVQDIRRRIDVVLADSDRIVSALELDEIRAAQGNHNSTSKSQGG